MRYQDLLKLPKESLDLQNQSKINFRLDAASKTFILILNCYNYY